MNLQTQQDPVTRGGGDGTLQDWSDIDLSLVFDPAYIPGLIGIAGMEIELSELLGQKVDLRTADDLSRYFRDEIL